MKRPKELDTELTLYTQPLQALLCKPTEALPGSSLSVFHLSPLPTEKGPGERQPGAPGGQGFSTGPSAGEEQGGTWRRAWCVVKGCALFRE